MPEVAMSYLMEVALRLNRRLDPVKARSVRMRPPTVESGRGYAAAQAMAASGSS